MTEGQVRARETPTAYKPTTKVVRDEWCYGVQDVDMDGNVVVSFDEAGRQFDRWLAEHDAQLIENIANVLHERSGGRPELWLREQAQARRKRA